MSGALCGVVCALLVVLQQNVPRPLTLQDLQPFVDSSFASYVQRSAEPSLAVVIVDRHGVVVSKGYGIEDGASRRPVDPDSTLFNIASLSKLFTATLVMQLVEQGRLQLDSSVALLEKRRQPPVTLRQLLTHTSGIDGEFMRDVASHPSQLLSLHEYFTTWPPRRGRPPGREIRYSNTGMALAGHLAEVAAGEEFAAAVQHRIFLPLGMSRSAFEQPPPARLRTRVATAGSGPVPDALLLYPAGAMVSTPSDIGRFMRMHLRKGELDGTRVLADSTTNAMHARQWSADPRVPGVAIGFFESHMGGQRGVFHTGARVHFSLLYILPERGVGIFVVHSMRQGGEFQNLRTDFVRSFIERYFPVAEESVRHGGLAPARRYAGVYRPVLVSSTTIERAAWLGLDTRVTADTDSSLSLRMPGGTRLTLLHTDDALYRVTTGSHAGMVAVFDTAPDGAVRRMSLSGATQDPLSFDRLPWYRRGAVHAAVLAIAFLVFVVTLLHGVMSLIRRHGSDPGAETTFAGRFGWRVARAVSACVILGPFSIAALIMLHTREDTAAQGLRTALTVGMTFLTVGAILGGALLPLSVLAWKDRCWSRTRRFAFSVVAAAAALSIPLLLYYRLLGFWF